MGGDGFTPLPTSFDEESSSDTESEFSVDSPRSSRGYDSDAKVQDDLLKSTLEFCGSVHPVDFVEANRKQKLRAFDEVLESYEELQNRIQSLDRAKTKILSYTPGAWIENAGGMTLSDYNVPSTTCLLLVGPKGSGKSSLVNRISTVFEADKFAPQRAQVSYDLSIGAQSAWDGTYFLREYMIPRWSSSFCLYDTRGLSYKSSTNIETLKYWMTEGVCHGEHILRNSDSWSFKTRKYNQSCKRGSCSKKIRRVNFVIFVVNALSVLKSVDSDDDPCYNEMIASAFNCPFLSFKDDKPVVVVTHGDLLSLSDRARVRVHLGQLLRIHPKKQIFDIPERSDPATDLAIVEMLQYSLEHADRNLPVNTFAILFYNILDFPLLKVIILLWVALVGLAAVILALRANVCAPPPPSTDWQAIKHFWLGDEYE